MRRCIVGVVAVGLTQLLACGDDGGSSAVDDTFDVSADTTSDSAINTPDGQNPPGDTHTPPAACDAPYPSGLSGLCSVSGNGDSLLLWGDVVLPDGIHQRSQVLVVDGWISCVGCDCASEPEAADATTIVCPQGLISPGLINAHDHITFTQMEPQAHGDTRWDHRNEWRTGLNGKPTINRTQNSHALGDAWGEIRQVMAGTTSLFGSGNERGFMRSLDRQSGLERLSHDDATYDTFPLGTSGIISSGCSYDDTPRSSALESAAYVPHVAEGVSDGARNEFVCMAGVGAGSVDVVADNSAFVHNVGVTAADIAIMAGKGASLVWSPRTNTDLYGFTAEVPLYRTLGVNVALGTDWTASGSVNMLRELVCAEQWSQRWGGVLSERELVAMATHWGAEALGFGDVLGSLTEGRVADIVIWDASVNSGYRAILDAQVDDVALVLRGGDPLRLDGQTYFQRGTPLYGDAELVAALADRQLDPAKYAPNSGPLPEACEIIEVCGRTKRLCVAEQLEERPDGSQYLSTWSISELRSTLEPISYGLFFCDTPTGEPTCVPSRPGEFDGLSSAGDADGDGIPDGQDNCPGAFNPPRPMDHLRQPNTDGDALGDVCDPCPFDADTTACTSVNPDDIDGDGFTNLSDNCPSHPNVDQSDADDDLVGDACDACPEFDNSGGRPCPATIYDVKRGVIASGEGVFIADMVVTAAGENFFFAQLDAQSDDFEGLEFSGLYVFHPDGLMPAPGDRVSLAGTVNNFFGQWQLTNASVEVDSSGAVPAATPVDSAEVAPGGAKEEAYEGLLVSVAEVEVLDVDPTPANSNEAIDNEFLVTGGLTVDDQLFLLEPFPVVGQVYSSLSGVLRFTWERNKLLVRGPQDVATGAAKLLSLQPATSWIYLGEHGQTVPDALTVGLTSGALEPTVVTLTSSDPDILTVDGGEVVFEVGESRKAVDITTVAPGGPVTVTATLNGDSLSAEVVVLPADVVPALTSLVADPDNLPIEGTTTLTLRLDLPAPHGGLVADITTSGAEVTVPSSLSIDHGAMEATFSLVATGALGEATVTAKVGESSISEVVTISDVPQVGLLLAEIFYNPSGDDSGREWIKLYNGTGSRLDLEGWSLGWGGSDYTTGKLNLSGVVAAGECFVVGGPTSDESNFSPLIDQPVSFSNGIQNSSSGAGDGIALFHAPSGDVQASTVPVDAVVYGGNNSNGLLSPDGTPFPDAVVHTTGSNRSLLRTAVDSWEINDTPNSVPCLVIQ